MHLVLFLLGRWIKSSHFSAPINIKWMTHTYTVPHTMTIPLSYTQIFVHLPASFAWRKVGCIIIRGLSASPAAELC